MKPTIGRIVIYRSKTGDYDIPAIVTATTETLNPKGVEEGKIPDLSSNEHVHLTVFTPGTPDPMLNLQEEASREPRSQNVAGTYQEWNIRRNKAAPENSVDGPVPGEPEPGTWRWPTKV